jgi:glycosyltransferase involved in cell wall biosynthesis
MHAKSLTWSQRDLAVQRHISIVTETYPPEINGVALTLAQLVSGLRMQGHAVSVVRPRQKRFDGLRCGYDPRVTLVPGLPLPGYRGLRVGLPAGRMLRRCWTEHHPDVVYVATEGPLGWSAVSTAQLLGIPVFSGFHTNFHNYSRYYHAGWLRFLILGYLHRFHSRTVGTIVASVDLRERLRAMGLKNVRVLDRGVDSRLFTPERRSAALRRRWCASDDDLVVLYVGRVAPEKNLGLAIESYRAMKRLNRSVKFVIVGDGPLRAALQQKHPALIFCGVHTGADLAEHYASADVFLFPSETETFGNVTLEAMASGLAVVAYDYAAARMHITDGETGVLVPYGRSSRFVDAAVKLAREPQCFTKIRQQARERAVTLDWQGVVDRFARILIGALQEDHAANAEPASEMIDAMDRATGAALTAH